ncbi:heterokaryon incompatibility protein-domain-containing protein [Xylaria grammica]|nr:heterokaryon incompatibility protein-domain-containing protein [Xylaria grammica]
MVGGDEDPRRGRNLHQQHPDRSTYKRPSVKQIPSPPRSSRDRRVPPPTPLSRNRSTGNRDNRLPQDGDAQRGYRITGFGRIDTSPYLHPNGNSEPPTFDYNPPPRIVVSEDPTPLGHPLQHSGRSWTRTVPKTDPPERPVRPRSLSSSSSSSGTLGANVYRYDELGSSQFRLVRIYSKKMSTIKCEIEHFSLTNPPPYIGISYAWGDADDKRPIQIGNVTVSVAVSLFGALDAVRKQGEDVFVWVDALCIDQQNRDERSQQVQLMTEIYAKATTVAIWLGPPENDSDLAKEFLKDISIARDEEIMELLLSPRRLRAVGALVCLFQRDYWKRLWVVQEVFNAKAIMVYCGDSIGLPWGVYERAASAFRRHKRDLDLYLSSSSMPRHRRQSALHNFLSYSQALVYEGPNSLYYDGSLDGFSEESLLGVMRTCRRKLTSEPRDKIFGILGILPHAIRKEFPVDYNMSVKEIYTNVVDFILCTTERLDVICESIHFPQQTGIANLPSWVPDWSLMPAVTSLGYEYNFAAAAGAHAEYRFLGDRRNELEISAILVDTVRIHGVTVGTLCTLADYLMAFFHWHAILIESASSASIGVHEMEEEFCRTLCLGQIPPHSEDRSRVYSPSEWKRICYYVFGDQMRSRLPRIPLNEDLQKYADIDLGGSNPRQFLQSNFGSRMMGRCFFLTEGDRMGMGTGFMSPDDIIIIPLGCRTPILIRKEGNKEGRYRFIGDVYLDGYMYGRAMRQLDAGERKVEKFVLI